MKVLPLILICATSLINAAYGFEGTSCNLNSTLEAGICKSIESCHFIFHDIKNGRPYNICGYEETVMIVCCPTKLPKVTIKTPTARISERKCEEYQSAVYEYVNSVSLFHGQDEWKRPVDKCAMREINLNISYGEYAQPREFPHMGVLGFVEDNQTSWICGCSLISDQFVLTAAHCVSTRKRVRYVRLGELNLESQLDDAEPEDFDVSEIILHPEYRPPIKYNDIALLKLNRKVKFSPYKRPLCLPSTNDVHDQHVLAIGYGETEYAGVSSSHLLKVTLEKFSYDECFKTYTKVRHLEEGIVNETQICFGSYNDSRSTCRGDSGSPVQIPHPKHYCMYTIIGIVSLGKGCGIPGVPEVSTRVFAYLDWIESTVWGVSDT